MKVVLSALLAFGLIWTRPVQASGPIGLFGIVERAVFEPDEANADRVQLWGAFAFADLYVGTPVTVGSARMVLPDNRHGDLSALARGYLYFRLPPPVPRTSIGSATDVQRIRREWSDLKRVAGTREAVAFGQWMAFGRFGDLQPTGRDSHMYSIHAASAQTSLRVRAAGEPPADPAVYQTNTGVAKVPSDGSRAAVVRALRALLEKP
jgi:hypothetical protein